MSTSSGPRDAGRTLLVGYGKLGTALAPLLEAEGADAIALRRTDAPLPQGVQGIVADVSRPLDGRLPRVDSMVVTMPPGEEVDGYRRMLQHLERALPDAPERTVFVSSTGVFAGVGPETPITEDDEPPLTSDRSRALRDGERAAVEMFGATVIRPSGIYGPGRDFLLRTVREGRAVDRRRWTNRIHEADLVRALHLLLRTPEPPALLHATDEQPVQLGEVVDFLAARLGVPAPPAAPVDEASGHILDGALLRRTLGDLEHPTYVSGYTEMLAAVDKP
ncbi:hypothetical protein [uncultured Microbacterium sp.]|uniref:hypothetical protein n=1 Tax=uncultured Microbacterium sp. TaxID=191216 RepID=UPI0028DB40A0|nr:hypothetical protein [uncultured Microbacterium sp.]